jgi:L-ascorbate metabolism protein UlaG (beta-lactamase superfamily)
MEIKYLGHSAFEIITNNKKILIDPFLIGVPNYKLENISDIFVTHGHADHLGSAIEISNKTGAKITTIFELANYCTQKGAFANGINLGGWINYDWGKVISVPAFHSSSTPEGFYAGCPCGYIFEIEGKRIYHAGDTCLNLEMKTIGEIHKPDIAMLPIGGHYTMDIEQATIASDWLSANIIIPMHYNTFETINVNITEFETKIKTINKKPIVLNVEQSYIL